MINIRELSIGSLVMVAHENGLHSIAEITGIHRDTVTVIIRDNLFDGFKTNFKPDTEHEVKIQYVSGIAIDGILLREIGFVEADRKGWQLIFYYGGMILLYRHDRRLGCASFRFMSDYRKSFIRISCHTVHRLQNIMRFLTEDLEFHYNNQISKT